MKTIKKLVVVVVILFVVAVVAVVIGGGYWLNDAAKAGIERVGPEVTGTPVQVGSVSLSPFSGSGSLTGLVIANPEGYKTDGAIKVGHASVKIELGSLLEDVIVIPEIIVDGAELTYELGGKGSNIGAIQKHINEVLGAEPSEGETKVIIDKFKLTSATVRVSASLLKGKAKTFSMPDIELTDIGRKSGGETVSEAAAQVLQPITQGALKTVLEQGIKVPDADVLKKRTLKTIDEKVEEMKKPIDKLKGLLNRE